MNEFELIERLTRQLPTNSTVVAGPGDDCAVLDIGLPDRHLLFKTDAIVSDIHFKLDAAAEKVGHKALARCLSDVAAMGGSPTAALVTLGLPADFDVSYVEGIYTGLNGLAARHKVAVAGGETTRNPGAYLISVAVLGTVDPNHCIRRKGARPGDAIFVTGELGGSLAGKHLEFEPRLAEGQWLATSFAIHAMIDVSDGLAGDLRHLMRGSGTGAELLSKSIPISRAAKLQSRGESSAKPPLLAALTDGEDFELLFTLAGKDAVPLLDAWKAKFPRTTLTCIGRVTDTAGIKLRDKDGLRDFNLRGYEHFSDEPRAQ